MGLLFLCSLSVDAALAAVETPVRFIMTGDTGTGKEGQKIVAKAIEKVCADKGCQFALFGGDNIYQKGVDSVRDSQFQYKFELPYERLKFPIFLTLGNHDQSGWRPGSGVYPENGDFEVEYTKVSKKWKMPSRYYSVTAPFKDPENPTLLNSNPILEVFVIDTNPLAPGAKPVYKWYLPGNEYDKNQRAWLRKSIEKSSASWKFVLGHHPYRSNGGHGNAGEFGGSSPQNGEELKKMFEQEACGKVDFIVSGHDHSIQWLKPYSSCGPKTEFIVSGAGAKASGGCSSFPECHSTDAYFEMYDTLGFFWAEATAKQIKIVAYVIDGGTPKVSFERVVSKP